MTLKAILKAIAIECGVLLYLIAITWFGAWFIFRPTERGAVFEIGITFVLSVYVVVRLGMVVWDLIPRKASHAE